jgi:hypothetical protein
MTRFSALWVPVVVLSAGCSLGIDPPPNVVTARFDPAAQVIPLPNDLVQDAQSHLLALPIDDSLTGAEKELRTWLNQLDGWPTTFTGATSFSGALDQTTIDDQTVQVFRWDTTPVEVPVTRSLSLDGTQLGVQPPEAGWDRGAQYVVMVRGGMNGVHGALKQPVVADAAFYFLRLKTPLDDPMHQRAFPGDTRDERLENAHKLEAIRQQLQPYFQFFEARGVPREEVASMWTFTATSRTELAMDAPSQRMPLPFDLLIDRSTGRIAIPPHAGDSPVEAEGKARLADYDGWGLSAGMMFETTTPLDPNLPPTSIELWDLTDPPKQLAITVKVHSDKQHVEITPTDLPLKEATTYGVLVRDTFKASDGRVVVPMTIGHFMTGASPIADGNGKSQVGGVADGDAARVEWTRVRIAKLLDTLGRDHIVTAWPFTTQTVVPRIQDLIKKTESLAQPAQPANVKHLTPAQAASDFPLGVLSLVNVGDVYEGTLPLPSWIDDKTRGWRADNQAAVRDVAFTLTIPRNATGPVPIAIFGHALATENRFALAVGDSLAQRGFATISIDFPLHGRQTKCAPGIAVIGVIDPQTGKLTTVPQCNSGSTCNELGECVDASGKGNNLAMWPIVNFPVASGATFVEIDHIANSRDHFLQAVIDLAGLSRSLRMADWSGVAKLDSTKIFYAGQSLGGILGGSFLPFAPEVQRGVLNVPGAGVVDMFRNSLYFAQFITGFFTRENIDPNSWQAARFLNLGRMIMDAADPASVAGLLDGRKVFLQMATLDEVIPTANTKLLQTIAGAPRRDYVAEHAFLVIPVETACFPGQADLADYLAGKLTP